MTPQDRFVIVAPVHRDKIDALRQHLKQMNHAGYPGVADPSNPLVPFGEFENIHFARFVLLADDTLEDRETYPGLRRCEPNCLCLMVDCDGSASELLTRMALECPGLRGIFEYCEGFPNARDLGSWMKAHRVHPPTSYVNWVGRTVEQVHQEARLHALLRSALLDCDEREPRELLGHLRKRVASKVALTSPKPTPLAWQLRNAVHFLAPIIIAVLCLLLFPLVTLALVLIGLAMVLVVLRRHEQTDPIIFQHLNRKRIEHLRAAEDHDVTNQYTALGSIKPGLFRLVLQLAIFYVLDWAARHICTRGRLGRISTIHFAHWLFLDNRRRGFFCSYYDGGHEPYMDDFINKAGFGLNFSFSGAIGYPGTDWLFKKGAWREQEFKRFQRRHQIPTDVWYNAYPGLTAHDLARNSRIRNGFEKQSMSDDEIRRWLAEI
jgi:hypothetical protein